VIYNCCNERRKSGVLGNPAWNGIDYLEVLDHEAEKLGITRQTTLVIHCLNPLASPALGSSSSGSRGSAASSSGLSSSGNSSSSNSSVSTTIGGWSAANVVIEGGASITDIGIVWVAPALEVPSTNQAELDYYSSLPDSLNVLVVRTNVAGDFSSYCLRLVNNALQAALDPFKVTEVLTGFDPQLASVDFSFKVECGPVFDCQPQPPPCAPQLPTAPPINYLAKDYASFRSILLDRLNQLLPDWAGSSEADLGITLAELIAYVGDYLSYQQDAVATEAYLQTARRRVSLRRHALLVDYHVHDGCNSRAWIHLEVGAPVVAGAAVVLDQASTLLYTSVPGMPANLKVGSPELEAGLLMGLQFFQPMHSADLYYEHNTLYFYTWGDTDCCLPQGATEATLLGSLTNLEPGDVLVFEEVIGPQTGSPADADLRHRCAVRLTQVSIYDGRGNLLQDALFDRANPVLLTEIQWANEDALPFPLCLSSNFIAGDGTNTYVNNVSVAHGNVVLVDHGLSIHGTSLGTVPEPRLKWPASSSTRCTPVAQTPVAVRYRPAIPDSPVTQAVPLALSGPPVMQGVAVFSPVGTVTLSDANGIASLLVEANAPLSWPQSFAVIVSAAASPARSIDVAVAYVGGGTPVTLESFTDLSLDPTSSDYAGTQINALSKFVSVPASFAAPPVAALGTLPSGSATYSVADGVVLQDLGSPPTTYLELQPTNPLNWPFLFGVTIQTTASSGSATDVALAVVYEPPGGAVGVEPPVMVERLPDISLSDATQISGLVKVQSLEGLPDPSLSANALVSTVADQAIPSITLQGPAAVARTSVQWNPLQDLLESAPTDTVFVLEIEADGTASVRFGDNTNGMLPHSGASFTADYRIGNGTAGNVGADTILNISSSPAVQPLLLSCRNPLPASGGTDPETNDQIRRRAPQAFLVQERAVTSVDYQTLAQTNPHVARAAASLRWTGSWYTALVAVEPTGGGNLSKSLARILQGNLERYRMAGQDLELGSPQYVSLEIELHVCVDPSYFSSDVEQALLQVLSNQPLTDGQKGVFYPDNFTFGQTVYLSPVYAAARSVAGVTSVVATTFQPQGVSTSQFLQSGEMPLGPMQVARLNNSRNFPDQGVLTLKMCGGKQ